MKFEGPSIDVGSLSDGFLAWFNCIRNPAVMCSGLIASENKLSSALRLWVATSSIALVINVPAYALHGIKITEAGFFLSSFVASLLALAAVPAVISSTLRLYRIPSGFVDVFVMYTIVTAAVLPIITLLSLPATFDMLSILQSAKQFHLDAWGVTRQVFAKLMSNRTGEVTPLMTAVVSPIVSVAGFALMTLFTHFVSQRYQADKFRVVSAVTLGLVFALVPMIVLGLFQLFVMYAFL